MEQLAAAISSPGLSAKTLRRIVNDNDARQARPHELREIARACDVPYEFFTADSPIQSPADELNERLGRIEDIVEYLSHWQEGEVLQRILEYRTETYGRLLERLDQIDRRLTAIEPSATEMPARLDAIEETLEPLVDLAVLRTAEDAAAAAGPGAQGEADEAWDGTDRRAPGRGSAGR